MSKDTPIIEMRPIVDPITEFGAAGNSQLLYPDSPNEGYVRIHSQDEENYLKHLWQSVFKATYNTSFYRLRIEQRVWWK